jgi:hypothetical protein
MLTKRPDGYLDTNPSGPLSEQLQGPDSFSEYKDPVYGPESPDDYTGSRRTVSLDPETVSRVTALRPLGVLPNNDARSASSFEAHALRTISGESKTSNPAYDAVLRRLPHAATLLRARHVRTLLESRTSSPPGALSTLASRVLRSRSRKSVPRLREGGLAFEGTTTDGGIRAGCLI